MNWLDTLVVSYVLDKQGVPFDLIEHFNDVLAQSIAVGEGDAIQLYKQLVVKAGKLAEFEDDDTGGAILTLLEHIGGRHHTGKRPIEMPHLKRVADLTRSPAPETSLDCRTLLQQAASALRPRELTASA